MATTTDVKNQVARRQQGNGKPPAPATMTHGHTLLDTLEQYKPQIARALPSMVNPDRFIRVALTTLRQTPKLLQCTPESVLGGLFTSAQLGLEPGPLGHAYLVPFWNRRKDSYEAQWIIGYTGIIDLARRSGHIETMVARAVYEEDHFEVEYGLNERLEHKPNLRTDDRGQLLYTYSIAKYVGGGHNFVVLGRSDIDKAKQQSQTGRKNEGPWVDHFEAMSLKTAVRRLRPFLPLSVEMRDAFSADERTRVWSGDDGQVIDIAPDPEPEIEAFTSGESADDGAQADAPEAEDVVEEEAGSGGGQPDPAPHPADTPSGSDASDEESKQEADEQTGSLSRTQYAELREAGFDDDTRSQLVYAATDGRTRRSKKLTADERRRIMKAAAAAKAGVLHVIAEGPDSQSALVDRDGAILAAPDLDELTWEEQLAGGDDS